jgi:hypothetical protein
MGIITTVVDPLLFCLDPDSDPALALTTDLDPAVALIFYLDPGLGSG